MLKWMGVAVTAAEPVRVLSALSVTVKVWSPAVPR